MILTSTVLSVSVSDPSSPYLILMSIVISLPGMRVPGSGAVGVPRLTRSSAAPVWSECALVRKGEAVSRVFVTRPE